MAIVDRNPAAAGKIDEFGIKGAARVPPLRTGRSWGAAPETRARTENAATQHRRRTSRRPVGLESQGIEFSKRQCGQSVATALVAGEGRLVDDDHSAFGVVQSDRGRGASWAGTDDQHITDGVAHVQRGYGWIGWSRSHRSIWAWGVTDAFRRLVGNMA